MRASAARSFCTTPHTSALSPKRGWRAAADRDGALAAVERTHLVHQVLRLFHGQGLRLSNVDLTVIAQKPRVGTYKAAIRKNVARLLHLPPERVNIKATTEEKLGFTGRVEGIKAQAAVCAVMDI